MTLHAEVIVFCNDFGWLVGGRGERRGLERKPPAHSQLLAGAARVSWPATLRRGGGQFRTGSSAGAGIARLLHVAGECRVTDTA